MRISYNETAQFALRQAQSGDRAAVSQQEKLTTGNRINQAGDDAAGLAVAERMSARYRSLLQARQNAQDAISLVQVADGTYSTVADMVQRVRGLAVQAANETLTDSDRNLIQKEVDELLVEIDRQGNSAQYNGRKILQGESTILDSLPATWSPTGTKWQELQDAIDNLADGNQTVKFTYSFMLEGVTADAGVTTDLADQVDGNVTRDRFKQEIREALAEWEGLFESVFSTKHGFGGNLAVEFEELGDEEGTTPASNGATNYTLPHANNVGDLRFGMHPIDGAGGTLAHAFGPSGTLRELGTVGGDTHFDSGDDFRVDGTTDPGGFSIKYVVAHEIGHALGLDHDTNAASLMFAAVGAGTNFATQFPNGLKGSETEIAALIGIYGASAQTETRGEYKFHVGAERDETIDFTFVAMSSASLGISNVKVRSREEASEAMTKLDKALTQIAGERAELGSVLNRLEDVHQNIQIAAQNTALGHSAVRDVDFSEAIVAQSKEQVLRDMRLSALSQSSLLQQNVLSLLS